MDEPSRALVPTLHLQRPISLSNLYYSQPRELLAGAREVNMNRITEVLPWVMAPNLTIDQIQL
jgi:hypothetical protein